MISIKINDLNFLVKPHISILEACKYVGITIPRFCYHETLSVAGNCRMCLVELEGLEKPVASCVTEIDEGMSIWVDTPYVKKARENVIETLLINHPLDCPICDQAGECDLQDQTKTFGSDHTRYFFNKRGVEDKNCGPLIKTIMTRCIHCTRCVRFGSEIAGIDFLGTLNRGTSTEIGSYVSKMFESEISGNVIDLCPVGALTSKPYAFKARPWELRLNESIDVTDSLGSNIYVNFKESEIFRILPKSNNEINESIISDKTRFSYDSINNNRIKNLFEKKGSKFDKLSWASFFSKFDLLIKNNQRINIIINDELDLSSIDLLKKISNKYLNTVKISTINSLRKKNNFFISNLTDKVNDIETTNDMCFLLSTNPKLESAVLNARVRFKYRNNKYEVFGLGQSFFTNIPSTFISLNIDNILKIFEGKSALLSKLLISTNAPLLLMGESFKSRFSGTTELIKFLYRTFPSTKIINILSFSNSQGAVLQNINNLNTSTLKSSNCSIAINLDDTLNLRNQINSLKKPLVWLNSHGSKIALHSTLVVPTLTSFENEEIHINLEQRPQKTQKTFESFFDTRGTKNILWSAFNLPNTFLINKSSYLDYVFEIINTPEIFNKTKKKLSLLFTKNICTENTFSLLSKYPFKSTLEDFYISNKFSKNSFVMTQCSRSHRKLTSNFPKFN